MKGNQKGVVNLLESKNRNHKSSKKSRPVRESVRALSVESLSASDESEREGSERETKLEALGSRMSHIEKNQRILKRRAKKMEDKLTSIESKVEPSHGEYMDFR
ncbi:unnamed protein product [Brassica oleracea]